MMETAVKTIRPLGMPIGSIRAILALTIVGITIHQLLTGASVGLLLSETLMIVLAHYFASRRIIKLPPDLQKRLEAEGVIGADEQPLWLPRGSVRFIILTAFAFAIIVLLLQGRLFDYNTIGTIALIFAYLGGVLMRWFKGWGKKASKPPRFSLFTHLLALFVLLACFFVVLITISGELSGLPHWMEEILLAFILFYFGSR
jgi:hypothetical protein